MAQTDERQILELASRGDPDAFAVLVERYSSRLFAVCHNLLGNRQDAEDCVQEAFIKAYRSINSYHFRSSFYTWIYRIAINACLDLRRKSQHNPSFSLDESWDTEDSKVHLQIADAAALPDEQAEQAETIRLVRQEIAALPEDLRNIIVLRDLEGLSYQELAQILHIAQGTVKSRLSRARQMLIEHLALREQSGRDQRLTDKQT